MYSTIPPRAATQPMAPKRCRATPPGQTTRPAAPARCIATPLVHPPSHVTCQSPNHEPIVTGVRRRRNLVSGCMALTVAGQHIHHSSEGDSQVENLHAGEPRIRQLVRRRNGVGTDWRLRASVIRSYSASRALMSRSASHRQESIMTAASHSAPNRRKVALCSGVQSSADRGGAASGDSDKKRALVYLTSLRRQADGPF